jgi:carboxymethylenebutenolidase
MQTIDRQTAADFDQGLLDLYDEYVHGKITRREFAQRAAAFAVAGLTVEAILQTLSPNYAWAEQVKKDDARIVTEIIKYDSPLGGKNMKGLLAHPKEGTKLPAVLVIHENRGLNPYIEDVVRRLAVAGFIALGPDALAPLGGYPGNDDEGRTMQSKRKPEEMTEDFIAGAKLLQKHALSNGKVGTVGFCFGGGMVNDLAVKIPEIVNASVPYYGRQPNLADVPKINAPLLIHYAGLDKRINDGWPAYEKALKENKKAYETFIYPDVNHGFHNDTTPRFDEATAKLSWDRTIEFFKKNLN